MSALILDRGAWRVHSIPLVDAAQAQWIPAPDAVMFLMGTRDFGGRNLLYRFLISKNRWERAELPKDREIKGQALTWHDGKLWQYLQNAKLLPSAKPSKPSQMTFFGSDMWVVTPAWRPRATWK
jgi:hypothetical protein